MGSSQSFQVLPMIWLKFALVPISYILPRLSRVGGWRYLHLLAGKEVRYALGSKDSRVVLFAAAKYNVYPPKQRRTILNTDESIR